MKPIDVPICLGGRVCPIYPSLCMDDATHILETAIMGPVRVKATNDAARKALDALCGKDVAATVCGYLRGEGICQRLEAYYAAEAETAAEKLKAL